MLAGSRVAKRSGVKHAIGAPSNRWRRVFQLLSRDFGALVATKFNVAYRHLAGIPPRSPMSTIGVRADITK